MRNRPADCNTLHSVECL